jgi:hypothetical protein
LSVAPKWQFISRMGLGHTLSLEKHSMVRCFGELNMIISHATDKGEKGRGDVRIQSKKDTVRGSDRVSAPWIKMKKGKNASFVSWYYFFQNAFTPVT